MQIEMKDYNVIIDGRNFFDQPMKKIMQLAVYYVIPV